MSPLQWRELRNSLSVASYLDSIGFGCYPWERAFLDSSKKRKALVAARQAGKSYTSSGVPTHTSKYYPGSLSIVMAATERQAERDIKKILEFMSKDPTYPRIVKQSESKIELENKSEIIVVPATDKSARGDTRPRVIIMDEASRIANSVFRSGVRPMLNNNPDCTLILLSTPFGREGFFYRAFQSKEWDRYEIRSPWDVDDVSWRILPPALDEEAYQAERAKDGVKAWYSPEHKSFADQQGHLDDMGPREYRQEYLCEFVSPEGQVFGYDDVDAMFADEQALDMTPVAYSSEKALVLE